jgi:membrane protease YdiL (CAAX protease family)
MHDAGLMHAPRCYRDYRFVIALLAGALVLWLIHDLLPPFTHEIKFHWKLWLSLVIWQPIIEEILFRGIVQGQLRKTTWGQRAWLNISAANVLTSIMFVFMHMINNPPLFSISVIVPSLLFGYFRDRCNSVYPSILLHGAFNALVIEALFIHGNMVRLPL